MNQDGVYGSVKRLDRIKLFVAAGLAILLGFVARQAPERPTEAKIAEETQETVPAKADPLARDPAAPPPTLVAKPEPHQPPPAETEGTADTTSTPPPRELGAPTPSDEIASVTGPAEAPSTKRDYGAPTLAILDVEPSSSTQNAAESPATSSSPDPRIATTIVEIPRASPEGSLPAAPDAKAETMPIARALGDSPVGAISSSDAEPAAKPSREESDASPPATPIAAAEPVPATDELANGSATAGSADATTTLDTPEREPTSATAISESQSSVTSDNKATMSAAIKAPEPAPFAEPHASSGTSPDGLAAGTADASVQTGTEEPTEEGALETADVASDDAAKTPDHSIATRPTDTRVQSATDDLAAQSTSTEPRSPGTLAETAAPELPLDAAPVSMPPPDLSTSIEPAAPSPQPVGTIISAKPAGLSEPTETTGGSGSEAADSPQRPGLTDLEDGTSPAEVLPPQDVVSAPASVPYVGPTHSDRIRSWALMTLGDHAAWVGRIPEAISAYQTSAAIDPRNAVALRHLGDLYLYVLRDPHLAGYAYAGAIQRLTAAGRYRAAARWIWHVSRLNPQLTLELYARLYRK